MINKIFTLILALTCGLSFSQNIDPIYFDKKWKETSKENASFYRIKPSKKVGDLVLIEDFYINNTPQFQGYSLQSDENNYAGDIVWYDENGFDLSVYQFYNNTASSVLTYYYPNGKRLKTIQYKNGKKDGEHIVYHEDGTILIKGKYSKGQPIEGDFEEVRNWEDYRSNNSDREANEEKEHLTKMTVPVMVDDYSAGTKKKAIKKIIKSKIFWINSKQLAQEIWYDIEYDQLHPFKQVNYDQAGKVLQTINESDFKEYRNNILKGIIYEYYVQNQFAAAIKSKTSYEGGEKSGEEIKYYPNGKIQKFTKYINGKIVGDETFYDKDGAVMKKRTYKDGKPFDGNFDENLFWSLVSNANYVKGLREGEAIVKTDSDSIVAKGIYKNDKPYTGTFIVKTGEDVHELINVKNFKKNGLQKVFNYNIDDVNKTYNCLNDVVDGETIFYEDGEVTGKLEYKNGLPYNGKLVESNTAIVYKNGLVAEEIFYRSKYDRTEENNVLKSVYFENGKRTKIVNRSFLITSDKKDSYEGVYKNDKPYSGYFATDFNEFNHVDYYENGVIKYQYSNNYLENLEKYQYPNYDIKSTYKDGKIVDGPEYIKSEHQFISKYWKNGVLTSYDIDLFAMHYFNRFHFELKDKAIEITIFNSKKKAEIVIEKQGNKNSSKLIVGKKTLMSKSSVDINNTLPSDIAENILYYESDNEVLAKMISFEKHNLKDSEEDNSQEFTIITNLFISHINDNETIEANFNKIAEEFSTKRALETLLRGGEETGVLARLWFNKEKKPDFGILIEKNKNEMYDLKSFLKGKVLGEKKNVIFKDIRKEIDILEKKIKEDFK